ncbi:hypothetical protein KAR91_16980 [Candidatus Pacearchaeota archaeon]|nr:hypothetical protein [Candidatus Pacearchaeota archaeon]
MTLFMGLIVGSETGPNTEADENVRLLSVEITDDEDPQTVEMAGAGGIDYNPSDNAVAIVDDIGESYKVAVGVDDGIEPAVDRGEIEMYSTSEDGTSKQARVKCVNDGIVELNGDADFLVRYTKLQEAFDQLKSDFDGLVERVNTIIIETKFFATAYVPGGPTALGAPPLFIYSDATESPSTADIAPAKVEEVKTP